jgi:hypothetical protein
MPIQPVHQPPYVAKSDQSVRKGQAASMLAKKQLPTPQKRSTHSEAPEQTALRVANAVWLSLRMIGTDTPCSKKTDAPG